MPSQHKNPELGWRPPSELSAWVRAEAARRGVTLKTILDEALAEYRERRDPAARRARTGSQETG
jgi:hypothetical protein